MGKLLSENYKEILVIYDVTDDRRRRKLVKELGGYIVRVQKLDTQVWKVTMVDDIYYFKAFPANMSIFINRLHA